MCIFHLDEVPPHQPSHTQAARWDQSILEVFSSLTGVKSNAAMKLPQPDRDGHPPLLPASPAANELQGAQGGRSQHPQCSQPTAMAPAPLRLWPQHNPAHGASWKCQDPMFKVHLLRVKKQPEKSCSLCARIADSSACSSLVVFLGVERQERRMLLSEFSNLGQAGGWRDSVNTE